MKRLAPVRARGRGPRSPAALGLRSGLVAALATAGCEEDGEPLPESPPPTPVTEPEGDREGTVIHALGGRTLQGGEETIGCYSWTVGNDEALYVQAVHFENRGSVHHSNWFVVPESAYEGPDGDWACDERGFDTLAAAQSGTVLFAQSTQAWQESMTLAAGAVVKVPPRSRIVGELHLLNLSPAPRETRAWLTLDLIHPFDVQTVLVPLQLTYLDLLIPPGIRSRFLGQCTMPDVVIHHVLPHYHAAGDGFFLGSFATILNSEGEAEILEVPIVEREGFGAGPLGVTLDPPATAPPLLSFSCSYTNRYDRPLVWGIGIDEMCTMLALVEASSIHTGTVVQTHQTLLYEDVVLHAGECVRTQSPKGLAYEAPTDAERGARLYLPPGDESSGGPDEAVDACVDADPDAVPVAEPTLENLRAHVLTPWCSYSACHGQAAAGGLLLGAANLHGQLMNHSVQGPTALPLVAPGDPEGSWLYRVLARCDPGGGAAHMPRNAPVLLEDETVALVRAWIEEGAPP